MRAVRMDGNKCLSIRKAAWLTARSSEAGGAANGATATTAGAGDGKGKSGGREKGTMTGRDNIHGKEYPWTAVEQVCEGSRTGVARATTRVMPRPARAAGRPPGHCPPRKAQ